MKKNILIFTLIIISFSLIGCIKPSVPDVQQGNIIDQMAVDSLKIGMNKNEIRSILGDPVLVNTFDQSCWVYAYTNQIKGGKITTQNLRICFDSNGNLQNIQNDPSSVKK